MDISYEGISLNAVVYPNSYGLEKLEKSLYAAVEPVISGNVVELLPVISKPVVDLLVNKKSTLILEELIDSENLDRVGYEIFGIQSLLDSKFELSEPGSSADSVIDPYFIEVSKLLEQQNNQAKLAILHKVDEMALDEEKLEFIENNKYIISAQNIDDQQMILVSLLDTDNLIEDDQKNLLTCSLDSDKLTKDDTAFADTLLRNQDAERLDVLFKIRDLDFSLEHEQEERFLNYFSDENAVINQKQPETFLLLSKLNILEETSASEMAVGCAELASTNIATKVLDLSFSLIRDCKIDKKSAVQLSEIPDNSLNDSEFKSSGQKISKLGKFLGVNIEAYQSRLDSCKVLIIDELSKGDKSDQKKLQLLEAKRTNLENSIQAIENGRNSIIGSTQKDDYLQRQINEVLANMVGLEVL